MSKLGKFKDILAIGTAIGKPFLPGAAGSILDAVNKGINNKADPANEDALRALATDNDEQTKAILAVHARQNDMDERIKKLESR